MKNLYEAKPQKKRKLLTDKQIIAKLRAIRDDALLWLESVVETRSTAGSSTAVDMFTKAQSEIYRIEDRLADKTNSFSGTVSLVFKGPTAPESKIEE